MGTSSLNRAAGTLFGFLQIAPHLPSADPASRAVHRTPAPGRPPARTSNRAPSVVAAPPPRVPPAAVAVAVPGRRESLSSIGTVTVVTVGAKIALVGT
jgi:hypothetical protein